MKKLFGTDGIRGKANVFPLTPEVILLVGKVTAQLLAKNSDKKNKRIIIGKDTRISGYMLESALEAGICSMGIDVLLVGPLPTPAIAHLTKSFNAIGSIVISASHNPAKDNGVKLIGPDGYKLSDDIQAKIEEEVFAIRMGEKTLSGESIGKAFRVDEAQGRYIEFAKSTIKSQSLEGITIVLDCANGAGYKVGPKIFSELGAQVIEIGNSPNGENINKECGSTAPQAMIEKVLEVGADVGIALDGDADRIIMCDEKGDIVDGDDILALCALLFKKQGKLPHDSLVVTEYTNLGVDTALKEQGITTLRVENGDKYVLERMLADDLSLGGEKSGHIILHDYATGGDGIISGLQLLSIMKKEKKALSVIRKVYTPFPQQLVNIEVKEKRELKTLKAFSLIEEFREELGSKGRVFVRYSGTEMKCRVMVEAEQEEQAQLIASTVAQAIKDEIGD